MACNGAAEKWIIRGVVLAAIMILSLALQPFRKQAASYDLERIRQVEVVEADRLPRHLIHAVIAAEDARFFRHGGVDLKGVCRATWVNFRGRLGQQGASTITQQLARQSYGLLEKTMERKLVEAFLARRIEKRFSKEEILSHYLTVIYFGSGFYGIDAACRGYFEKRVEDLTVAEAATLVGLIKAPSALQPFDHPARALKARNLVLSRMVEEELLSDDEAERLSRRPIWNSGAAPATRPL